MEHRKCHQQIPDRWVLLAFSPATPRRVLTRVVQLSPLCSTSILPAARPRTRAGPGGRCPPVPVRGAWPVPLVAAAAGGPVPAQQQDAGQMLPLARCLATGTRAPRRLCGHAASPPSLGVTSAGRCETTWGSRPSRPEQNPKRACACAREELACLPEEDTVFTTVERRKVLRGKPNTRRGRTCGAGFVN